MPTTVCWHARCHFREARAQRRERWSCRTQNLLCDPVIFQRGDPIARGNPVPRRFLAFFHRANASFNTAVGGSLADASVPRTTDGTRVGESRLMHHFVSRLLKIPGFRLTVKQPVQLNCRFSRKLFHPIRRRTKPLRELILTRGPISDSQPPDRKRWRHNRIDATNSLLWRADRCGLSRTDARYPPAITGDDGTMFGRPVTLTDSEIAVPYTPSLSKYPGIGADVRFRQRGYQHTASEPDDRTATALFALNSPFMLARADALAKRLRV